VHILYRYIIHATALNAMIVNKIMSTSNYHRTSLPNITSSANYVAVSEAPWELLASLAITMANCNGIYSLTFITQWKVIVKTRKLALKGLV
jgi:hypothetical protein